jgi:imidazoleglycerol phosphate synthase glutamine amidotransferase subunit HisH
VSDKKLLLRGLWNWKLLDDASHIIFPGVGAAGTAMANLRESALDGHLKRWVREGNHVALVTERKEETPAVR